MNRAGHLLTCDWMDSISFMTTLTLGIQAVKLQAAKLQAALLQQLKARWHQDARYKTAYLFKIWDGYDLYLMVRSGSCISIWVSQGLHCSATYAVSLYGYHV